MPSLDLSRLYGERFDPAERARKERVWGVLCRHFFQHYVAPDDTVLDLGAGMCEFINHIRCGRRIAVDQNPEVARWAARGVEVVVGELSDLSAVPPDSVDVVFASNVFEHLPSKEALVTAVLEARRVLRSGGRLLVLQPNIRVVGGKYWDFLDHRIPISDRTLVEVFRLVDLAVQEVRPRFLPFTSKSRLPQQPLLVRLYLVLRPAHWLIGGQAWLVAQKP